MSANVQCCGPEDTLDRVAEQLWQRDCGCLPVVDEAGKLHAMVTDRDICMAAFTTGRPLPSIRVRECMSTPPVSCGPDDSVAQAAKTMAQHQVRRLPVVDAAGKVQGVLSVNDLLLSVAAGAPSTEVLTVLTAVARHRGAEASRDESGERTAELRPAARTSKPEAEAKAKAEAKPRTETTAPRGKGANKKAKGAGRKKA